MDFRKKLVNRINIGDIYEVLSLVKADDDRRQELYRLLFDEEDMVAYQAGWVLTHLTKEEGRWLFARQDELIDEVLVCRHPGKRRLLLNLLLKQPFQDDFRVDFLDFCLEHMVSPQELPGVQTLCMKLAYDLCRREPELLREFGAILEMQETSALPPSIRSVRRKILKH